MIQLKSIFSVSLHLLPSDTRMRYDVSGKPVTALVGGERKDAVIA